MVGMLLLAEDDIYNFVYTKQKDFFIQIKKNLEILFVNQSFCNAFSIDETQIVGKNLGEYLNEKLKNEIVKEIRYLNKFKPYSKANYKIKFGKSKSVWYEWEYYAILNEEHVVEKYNILAREIKQDKTIENMFFFQNDILKKLSGIKNFSEALRVLVEKFKSIEAFDSGILYLYNKEKDIFYLKDYIDINEVFLSNKNFYNKIQVDTKSNLDQVIYVEQIDEFKKENIMSIAKIPLKTDSDSFGLIVLVSHKNMIIPKALKLIIESMRYQISNIISKLTYIDELNNTNNIIENLYNIEGINFYIFNKSGEIYPLKETSKFTQLPIPDDIISMLKNSSDIININEYKDFNYYMLIDGNNSYFELRLFRVSKLEYIIRIQDKSVLEKKDIKIKKQNEMLEYIIDVGNIGIIEIKEDKVFFNESILNILKYPKENNTLSFETFKKLIHVNDIEKFNFYYLDFKNSKNGYFEYKFRMKKYDNNYIWIMLKAKKTENDKLYKFIAYDITKFKTEENEIKELLIKDNITKLYNKTFFLKELDNEFKKLRSNINLFSVVMIYIENLNDILDTYGLDIRDYVLEKFAKHVKDNLREQDLVARYSEDKFVMILKNIVNDNSEIVVKRILDSFSIEQIEEGLKYKTLFFDTDIVDQNIDLEKIIDDMVDKISTLENNFEHIKPIKN
jgi:diguanylate cyclase (GGDEF)-like protein